MKRIIIDTNALMAVMELKIDIFGELERTCDFPYELCIVGSSLEELNKIKNQQRGKFKRAARIAEALIQNKKIKIIPEPREVDKALVDYSRQGDIILTQDRELKKKLMPPYLTIREKKRIIIVV